MPRYQDFSKTAQQPLNYLGQNTGVQDPTGSKPQSASSLGDLKDLFGELTQQGAVDFAKNIFGGGSGYADTIAKWNQLAGGAKGFAGGAGGAGGLGAAGGLW